MPRPLASYPGVVLLVAALACQAEPAAERSAPRVIFQSPSSQIDASTGVPLGPAGGSPEVIVLGESQAGAGEEPAPRPARRPDPEPRVIVRTIYVEAPPEEPRDLEPAYEPVSADPDPVYEPVASSEPVYEPPGPTPTTFPAPDEGPNRTEDAIVGAAIGAGIGAVLGGRDGAVRGGIGGAVGGAVGGRGGAILGGVLGGSSRSGGVLGGGRGRLPRRGGDRCYAAPFSSPSAFPAGVSLELVSR